ncbi:polycomb group protein Psc [Wyeomyia smithii]|uniref:polycomb group protein Psc n=1 Tax=Wyeomyia smithii TaxID=174621 RepID=UPI002467B18B|nr:polycomb group protein Psc [Wyeomyia smithii]
MSTEVAKVTKTTTVVNGPESPYKPARIHLSSVNPYITCNLCKGYLIDATTIVECLHSFCHSCIMQHLRTEQYCPQCEMMINKAKPNIKPDATLQAIVYKLVPGLYEKELLRKRAFYRQNPEMAALATPEQRGEDTEHLIFSPSEEFQLSLEYADKELAGDNEELKRPKYLQCPAMVRIACLKKFIINKYNIPTHLYYVEIMYKVQTITLPDHYTLMDVAYIYTWKKNDSMEFFFRIRTHEMKSVELPEVPLRRSPSISTGRQSSTSALATIKEEENIDSNENVTLIKPSDIKREESSLTDGEGKPSDDTSLTIATSLTQTVMTPMTTTAVAMRPTPVSIVAGVSESMLDVKPNVTAMGKQQQQHENRCSSGERTGNGVLVAVPTVPPPKVKKNESIKLKIEMNKNTYVSILQSPQPDAGSKHHKSDKSEKVKKKKSEDKDKSVNKIKSSSDLKIKIEKVKDGLVSVKRDGKSSKKMPYKVELSGVSDFKNGKQIVNDFDLKKAKKEAQKLDKSSKKVKSPKRNLDLEKVQPSIVLKIDQKSPELSTSTFKIVSQPFATSSPKQKAELSLEDEKSQFLNSFELTPIKSLQGNQSRSPSCSPGSSSSSSSTNNEPKQGKRKNKDALNGRSMPKKPKLSDDEMKALVERTVQQNIKSTVNNNGPPPPNSIPIRLVKPELETSLPVKNALPPQPLPIKSDHSVKTTPKQDLKQKVFDFKPPTLPPPVVTTTNIPAPKPAQPVMIAPKPSSELLKRPAVPSFPKPIQPTKKLPPLLPKDVDYMKNNKQKLLEMKRSMQNPPIISPNKDTEISQIKPEHAKKNIKVYGPPADNGNFAVPTAISSVSKPKVKQHRPVNYLNYALMNANKAPAGSRTPIPSYSNSPSYSPDSPQYNPNFNISTKQYKYANPLAYANFLQNMLNDRKTSNVSPPQSVQERKAEPVTERKRACPSPDSKQEPPEKQPKVQSLLNQINIPSSLSITLATEEDEAAREKARKSLPEDDKNYIEILKLPEISITEAERTTPPKTQQDTSNKKPAKSPSPGKSEKNKSQSEGKNTSLEADNASFQQKFIQSIRVEKEPKVKNKPSNKSEKQHSPVFTPPVPASNSNAFKLPNATVLSNGIVKLNSYPELDLINKTNASPRPALSPPKPIGPKHVPIAPKPTGTFFPPTGTPSMLPTNRKSLSPPVPKPSVSPGHPKSKTPPAMSSTPSHAALAAMGPMFGLQMNQDNANFNQAKKNEMKPRRPSQKSPKPNVLDLSSQNSPTAASAAFAPTEKSKDAMNMLMMNNNLNNTQKLQVANYLNEVAKLNNSGMMVPQMMGLQPNPFLNQMMQAYYLQQLSRIAKAGNDNNLEK